MLRLHDTATGNVRPLELRDPGRVSMYVCGLTVYDHAHIGHGRMALVFDVLRRYLVFSGLDVHFVSNVTDVDDRIISRAARERRSEIEVAREFEASWWATADALGVLRPDDIPHATQYIEGMVSLVADLLRREVAYRTSTGVYLDVERIDGYGLLARQSLESLRSGARIEVDEEKRSPLDFAVWKKAKPGEPIWEAPFGAGRPGWHTECVVMSLDLLGDDFDLHGGGTDLIFPHHENERAQAVAENRRFARHWMHNGWVTVGGEKMGKSLGNFTTIESMLERSDPRAYRLLVLRSQYRSQIEVTPETTADAQRGLDRLDRLAQRFSIAEFVGLSTTTVADVGAEGMVTEEVERFRACMDDDLDTPGALAGIFDAASRAHALADAGDAPAAEPLARTVALLCAALGLELNGGATELDEDARRLVAERDAARASGDYGRSDAIRDRLVARGWTVEDGPTGTRLRR
ncbi:MAG: cysteine--tRNA ligase [Acidimicrobiales bacterium]